MYNKFFSERLRLLREYHNLSLNQLADILGKKKSSISDIEAGRIGTTLDVLTNISNLFAVSVDWLLGRTKSTYSIEIIENLENDLIVEQSENFFEEIKAFYEVKENYYSMRDKYELEERADFIFALTFWKYFANKLTQSGYKTKNLDINDAINYLAMNSSSKRGGNFFKKMCQEVIDIMENV